jgi:uncharacterized protein YdhG (YjbR/CyaY superfamily)
MDILNEVDKYILGFPGEIQLLLQQMRVTIRNATPEAEEIISYGMPSYRLGGLLVHFAGYKNHIGFYPAPSGIEAFKKELSVYKGAKGSVQFQLDKPLPLDLISQIVEFRAIENREKAKTRKK